MKKIIKLSALAIAPFFGLNVQANTGFDVGLSYGARFLSHAENEGKGVFAKQLHQFGVAGSYGFNESFAIELAGFKSLDAKNNSAHEKGEMFLGHTLSKHYQKELNVDSNLGLWGAGLSLLGKYYVMPGLKVFASAGVSYYSISYKVNTTSEDNAARIKALYSFENKKSAVLPKLSVGIDYLISDNIGVKGHAAWENTGALASSVCTKFKDNFSEDNSEHTIKPKNSLVFGVSVYFVI